MQAARKPRTLLDMLNVEQLPLRSCCLGQGRLRQLHHAQSTTAVSGAGAGHRQPRGHERTKKRFTLGPRHNMALNVDPNNR